jgi:cell filamentation protein
MSDHPEWDAYYIPGSLVLKNNLNITDTLKLESAERKITGFRVAEISNNPLPGDYDLPHLQAMHQKIFGDVYPFAGELRTVDMTKRGPDGETSFTIKELVPARGAQLAEDIKAHHYLRGMDKEEFSLVMANVTADANMLHPFREGNGRTTRVFVEQLAKEAGYEVDFTKINKKEWQMAVIAASRGNKGGVWVHPDKQDLEPLQKLIAESAQYEPALAFDRLEPTDALALYPQLDGAYASLADAEREGKDLGAERARISAELHAGRPVAGASAEHSFVAINRAARERGLFIRDASEVSGPQRGEVVATSSHHVLLKTGDGEAVRYPREALQSPVHANDKVMIDGRKVRDLSLDKPAPEYAVGKAAETGKTYDGPILSVSDKYVLQVTSEGVIRHNRVSLNGATTLAMGEQMNVRYPYENVGFVKQGLGAAGGKEISLQHKQPGIGRDRK